MGEEAAVERYEPGPAFEEVKEEAVLDLSPTDSKEFLLIQWIRDKDLDVSDFHGKELSLKLHKDGNLGSLESSSGKSYDLVSFAYQQPNATVFLPSGSQMKAVGKISRRVCLVHHQLEPNIWSLKCRSKKSAVAQRHPKDLLYDYTVIRGIQKPLYCSMQIGSPHEPLFKSKVVIDGLTFESPEEYCTRKAAELAAAKLALTSLPQAAKTLGSLTAGSSRKALTRKRKDRKASDSSSPVLGGSDIQNAMSMQSTEQEIQNGEPGPSVPQISTVRCSKTNDSDAGSSRKALTKKKKSCAKKAVPKNKKKISRFIATRLAKYCSSQGSATEMSQTTPEEPPKKKVRIAEQ